MFSLLRYTARRGRSVVPLSYKVNECSMRVSESVAASRGLSSHTRPERAIGGRSVAPLLPAAHAPSCGCACGASASWSCASPSRRPRPASGRGLFFGERAAGHSFAIVSTPKRVPTLAALALSPWRPHELFVKALKCAPVRAATGRAIATAPREAPSASIVEFFCVCLLLLFGSPFS